MQSINGNLHNITKTLYYKFNNTHNINPSN